MGNLRYSAFCVSHLAKTNWCIASYPTQGEAQVWPLDILGILTTYEDEGYDHNNGK